MFSASAETQVSPRELEKRATVTLSVFDSFGHPQKGCRVLGFVSFNEGDRSDYKTRFDGLIGRDIPLGNSYRADIRCTDEQARGSFLVSVDRSDEFIVLGAWLHSGDYDTGQAPRLTASTTANSGSQSLSDWWIKIVAVYGNRWEVDKVDPSSHAARFYAVEPGRYLMLLANGEKLVCTKQIDILGPHARMTVSLSDHGCKIENLSSVSLVD